MGTKSIWRAVSLGVAGAVAAASLAACGGPGGGEAEVVQGKDQGPRLETRQAGSRRAGPISPREFEFVRYDIDVAQDLPRACLTFSTTLDPAKDYRPYVDVQPATQIALSVEGANLCVGGLTFRRSAPDHHPLRPALARQPHAGL